MNDFICQTSNKTYPHVSTVKIDISISCGTPDLDAHAEKMGNPVVVFHDVATDCGHRWRCMLSTIYYYYLVKKARSTLALVYWYTDIDVPRARFCLLLGVSSGCAWPITGQVTSVAWPVIGWAQTELTLRKRQKIGPDSIIVLLWCLCQFFKNKSVHGHLIFITQRIIMSYRKWKKKYH